MKDLLDFKDLFDSKEKESKLTSIGVNSTVDTKQTISSGILTFDLITSGGLQRGRAYEIIGPEHGGKTTILYSCFGQALKCIPRKLKGIFLDIEGLVDPTWFGHITDQTSMDEVFGKKSKDGEWIIEPQIRYYKPSFGEQGLKFIKRILKVMPDKILIGQTWYHMWSPRAPKVVAKVGGWTIEDLRKTLDGRYSKKLLTKYGNFYVPIEDNYGGPEMIIGVDSWVAMTPEAIAEEDSDALASQARMFAKHLNDVKSLISSKGVALVGINQIRMTPMAYGCVHADTNIPLVSGESHTIREIVEKKIIGEVYSYNEKTGKIEPKKIINWFYNGKVDEKNDWIIIKTNGIGTKNGCNAITVTPDHRILVKRDENEKWIKARNVKIGDKLVSKYNSKINGTLRNFLYGVFAGDSTLVKSHKNTAYLRLQNNEQPEYQEWKVNKLKDIYAFREYTCSNGKKVTATNSTYELLKYNKKIGKRNFINLNSKYFNKLSLAILYMDEGSLHRRQGKLCISRFKEDEFLVKKIIKLIKDLGYKVTIKNKDKYYIFKQPDFILLCKDICTFIPKCMQYKLLPEYRGKYKDFSLDFEEKIKKVYVTVTDVNIGSDRKFKQKGKYDIGIEDNKNYLAGNVNNGVIIHNSPESTPGGNTLKHMTDVRIRVQAISNQNGKGMTEEEDTDAYRHFKLKTIKNKTFIPFLEAAGRWWISHDGNSGYGPDPVQDVLNYLKMTSQFKPDKKGFYITFISKSEKLLALRETRFTYESFKELVLSKKLGKVSLDLKKICHKQISHGNGLDLYLSGNPADFSEEEPETEGDD